MPERAGRRVGVLVPTGFPGIPTYHLPDEFDRPAAGARVAVPFGSKLLTGVVAPGIPDPPPGDVVERDVAAVLDDEPFVPEPLLRVLTRAAAYYFVPPGDLLRAAVPARLLAAASAVWTPGAGAVGASPTDALEADLLSALLSRGRARLDELAAAAGRPGVLRALRALESRGEAHVFTAETRGARAPVTKAWSGRDREDGEALLARSPKARSAWRALLAAGRPVAGAEARAFGATPALLSRLVSLGLAAVVEEEARTDLRAHAGGMRAPAAVVPTEAQAAALGAIEAALAAGESASFLLDGVTGSGKTEVYLGAIERATRRGRRAILLVPEIALAPALLSRLLARFGERVSLLHSGLTDGERAAEWEKARRGNADVVVGPRSAIFAPVPDLGLVVVDEAHESTYKQGEAPRYDARAVARVRAAEENAVLLFGSATPAMEEENAAREGSLPRLRLPARPGARRPAAVETVDLRSEKAEEGDHGRVLFATRTIALLRASLERGEQVIVLLNRRGFSPSLLCRSCGEDFRCDLCSVSRTYHRRNERLVCHYCGGWIRKPAACPSCASTVLMAVGFGTERLADRFETVFPGVPYAVLDRDAARRRGGAAGVLADFESGRARALLGTQMVAKGHDFPDATALAVLDADALLSFPDFRAAERTFQLVTQAAGRVGRGDKPGVVAVQTARPDHEAIRFAAAQDHAGFADAELRFRRAFRYPPFTRLLLALWSDEDLGKAEAAARTGAEALARSEAAAAVRVVGPAPAPLERLKGQWRFHLLVKAARRDAIAAAGRVLAALPEPPRLDVDPQNLL